MALSPLLSIATHIAIPSSAMASSILCKPFSFTVRQLCEAAVWENRGGQGGARAQRGAGGWICQN